MQESLLNRNKIIVEIQIIVILYDSSLKIYKNLINENNKHIIITPVVVVAVVVVVGVVVGAKMINRIVIITNL